jgi:hypothetical protein
MSRSTVNPRSFSAHSGTGSRKKDAMTIEEKPELPTIPFASRNAWEAWLEEHHATSDGLWLKIAKRARVWGPSPSRRP